ncbi:MAG: radical SAM protein, partial [Deltaproteobacteria bacterium]
MLKLGTIAGSFFELLNRINTEGLTASLEKVDERRVLRAISLAPQNDIPALFSRAAQGLLEKMAQRANRITLARFGRAVNLYAPLYLSNSCVNRCSYCGFAAHRQIPRIELDSAEALEQADFLLRQGIRHLLLVTGEDRRSYGLERILEISRLLRPRVASLSVEIFPCSEEEYRLLAAAGVDGVVLYQETYQRAVYDSVHRGPKKDFLRRLGAIEASARAGMRTLGVGVLLGLAEPRLDACLLAMHAIWLQARFPGVRIAVSFPRMRPVEGGLPVQHEVDDSLLVQLVVAMRILLPDAELVLSTREPASLRDRMLPLGITRVSAGSRTTPG